MLGHDLFVSGGDLCHVDACVDFHVCYYHIGALKNIQTSEEMGVLFSARSLTIGGVGHIGMQGKAVAMLEVSVMRWVLFADSWMSL